MLALQVADYPSRFGEIPRSDLLRLLGMIEISDVQAKLLRDGMQTLTGYLASVMEGDPDEKVRRLQRFLRDAQYSAMPSSRLPSTKSKSANSS